MTDDLRFAGKLPVVINRNGDTRDIYNPIRSSSCDITVVSNKILSDLYTNDKKGIKVKVEKYDDYIGETSVLFEGYMTPNSYTQKLSPNLDNIDMTCIDPLAVLKYLYIDDILEKAKSITLGELIAKALAAVKIDCIDLWIENTVSYTDAENVNYNFVDLVLQTSNFWDEGDDPSSVYDAVSECLRLFGYTLTFTGERYMIYNVISDHDFGTNYRDFTWYKIEDGGTLRSVGSQMVYKEDHHFKHSAGDWTTIDDNPSVSIDNTYDKIVSVASTKIPNYSLTAFDLVSSDNREMYDAGDLNVQRNKIKGYDDNKKLNTSDEWYYLWNGVYINDDYELDIKPDRIVNGYININSAYKYMTGLTGHPDAYGGILNFYGGEENLVGTNKDPQVERPVDVKKCITVFAPDNGTPPEFLEKEDLKWNMYVEWDNNEDGQSRPKSYSLSKPDASNSKYGTNKTGIADAVSYSQKYENITISKETDQTLVIELSHSYSRTGSNQRFSIFDYSNVVDREFMLIDGGDESYYWGCELTKGTPYTYPHIWQPNEITVSRGYFDKYDNNKGFGIGDNEIFRILPVWDKRKMVISVELLDGTKYQFNGKEWVETTEIGDANAFYFAKLMNNTHIFNDDFRYDCIEMKDGTIYSLKEDGQTIMFDKYGRITTKKSNKESEKKIDYYAATGNDWLKNIDSVSEGQLAIILPRIDAVNVLVKCDIYHSNLLGITGNSTHGAPSNAAHWVKYEVSGQYYHDGNYGQLNESLIGDRYGDIKMQPVELSWAPINNTYIKAEHLDLNISLSVPESNLGQMFGESDIKYSTNHSKRFREAYDAPSFLVNTKHPIVAQSQSYVMVGNAQANANKFSIGWMNNKIPCRPENYVMQGYKNYWGVIRRTYNRVLVPNKAGFSNCLCYIEAPDIPDVGNGRWLMVVSDSWDVKTNRHTISAVEDYDLNVNQIENYTVLEIPRQSRNPRFDLPSVQKRTKTT